MSMITYQNKKYWNRAAAGVGSVKCVFVCGQHMKEYESINLHYVWSLTSKVCDVANAVERLPSAATSESQQIWRLKLISIDRTSKAQAQKWCF